MFCEEKMYNRATQTLIVHTKDKDLKYYLKQNYYVNLRR